MVNLTKAVCSYRFSDAALAMSSRLDAAMLWAELHQETSDTSCFDCVSMRTGNCTEWFAHSYGLSKDAGPRAEAHRRLREELRASEPHRRRKLEEALDASCCRVSRRTGQKECKKEFCHKAFKQRAHQRMGHVLRRMHELGHVELSVEQQVAVDVLSPHIHSDERCRAKHVGADRSSAGVSELECVASSIATHIAAKHGISTKAVDDELARHGLSIAKMIAQPLKVATAVPDFKSNPVFATLAAKVRSRQMKQERTPSHPRGRALKDARASADQAPVNAPKHRRPRTAQRRARHAAGGWLHNASQFAKGVGRAARDNEASSLMPTVHTPSSPSVLKAASDTMMAVVGSEGSVVQVVARSATSVGGIIERGRRVAEQIAQHRDQPVTRKSGEHVNAFFEQVESRVVSSVYGRRLQDVGFTPPDHHKESAGWVAGFADWPKVVSQVHHSARVLLERHDHAMDHVDRTGKLPGGPLHERHRTGIAALDLNAPPSVLGNWFRSLHSWASKRSGHENHKRRMQESTSLPRQDGHQRGPLASAFDAAVAGGDAGAALFAALEESDRHTSHARRLAQKVFQAVSAVPVMSKPFSGRYSSYTASSSPDDFFTGIARYIVYGTLHCLHMPCLNTYSRTWLRADGVLCYLYAPDSANGGDFGDGTRMSTHRTQRMCLGMIPYGISTMPSFRENYQLGNLDFDQLDFQNACNADSVKQVLGALGQDWARISLWSGPFGGLLRVAEGVDAIRNLAASGMSNATATERGAAIVCGVTQLGGLLFATFTVVVALILCVCAPLGSVLFLWLWRTCCRGDSRVQRELAELRRETRAERDKNRELNLIARLSMLESPKKLKEEKKPLIEKDEDENTL
jgi:hypothetical protein